MEIHCSFLTHVQYGCFSTTKTLITRRYGWSTQKLNRGSSNSDSTQTDSVWLHGLTFYSVAPNKSGITYTIPTIQLQSGEWIMESSEIGRRLEQLYPNPALDSSALDVEIDALTEKVMGIISPDFIPKIPRTLISAASVPYWRETREAWYDGLPLDSIETTHGGEHVYIAARPHVRRLASLLDSASDGPFFGGKRPIYGDFVWAGVLFFYEKLGKDMLANLTSPDQEKHMELLEACRPWFERDDR